MKFFLEQFSQRQLTGQKTGANFRLKRNERGVALVISLIMLSVITFLTVAFLAVSRRDRAAVTTALNQTDSRLMANTALDRFQSDLVAGMMARNDLYSYDLMLTRNYINPNGFDAALGRDTNNVNYDFKVGGIPLTANDHIINIANLYFDPRPPVFIKTNSNPNAPLDFRFYLDYNRNGRFETNGLVDVVIDEVGTTAGKAEMIGEPEWIGVLQNPELPHGPNNKFIGRYLYFALPIGKTLDWNYIHNYAKGNLTLPANMNSGDGFLRNQGVGSWEMNLGGFLVDLNTNMYVNNAISTYTYYPDVTSGAFANTGDAFNDSLSLLKYRYGNNISATPFNNLSNVAGLFPGNGTTAFNGATAFRNDFIDGYTTRPVLTTPFVHVDDPDLKPIDLTGRPWSGSDNVNRLINPQELFNTNKTSANFVMQLQKVSTNNNSYDRYTFSRLLQQIGMGSAPEVKGKININYVNDPKVNTVSTNFAEWTPIQFFTNTVDRLFKDNLTYKIVGGVTNWYMFNTTNNANLVHAGFSYTNIQIWPTNEYTPQLHRLLQVAANIYDATSTNKFPTVFRPQFASRNGTNFITGYVEVGTNLTFMNNRWTNRAASTLNQDDNIFGVPLIVGAKKGFPNFNKFVAQTSVQITRNLQLIRPNTTSRPNQTNQMIVLGISNVFGLQAWNSYSQKYMPSVQLLATNFVSMSLTNENGQIIWPPSGTALQTNFTVPVTGTYSQWPGATDKPAGSFTNSFILPFGTNSMAFLPNSQYLGAGNFSLNTNIFYARPSEFPLPTWGINMTNRLVYAAIDVNAQRIIDFVNLDGLTTQIDIQKQLSNTEGLKSSVRDKNLGNDSDIALLYDLWSPKRSGGNTVPPDGVKLQIAVSKGSETISDFLWTSFNSSLNSKQLGQASFAKFMDETNSPSLVIQTPYNPVRRFDQTYIWEANDPLVHYIPEDLIGTNKPVVYERFLGSTDPDQTQVLKLREMSAHYNPWGGNHKPFEILNKDDGSDPHAYNWTLKDPGITRSDDWNFPTNKFPSIGWLGRVHRGTPWQTIYLKAAAIADTNWFPWAGHAESHPTNDWHLMDVFTTSPNDNAASGLLSVNQTNQAAWSAVLSGVIALSNSVPDAQLKAPEGRKFQSYVIQPNSPQVKSIVTNLFALRQSQPNRVFHSIGDILAAPALTAGYLNPGGTNQTFLASDYLNFSPTQVYYGLTDDVVERIPQQIMSLLKVGEPRYVVYAYGQSLKPANNSLVLSPPSGSGLFNLCTNYQITGEVLTRTVLRVEPNPDAQHPKTVIESYNIISSDE